MRHVELLQAKLAHRNFAHEHITIQRTLLAHRDQPPKTAIDQVAIAAVISYAEAIV